MFKVVNLLLILSKIDKKFNFLLIIIFSPKLHNQDVFMNEEDSQNPFGFLNNSSKQIDWLSSKGIEDKQLNSQPKEDLEFENEERIIEQKEQLDPIQSAKKSTNVDSNLKNEQILEDQDMENGEDNEQFQKDLNIDMEPEEESPNRTLEEKDSNQINLKEVPELQEKEPERIEVDPQMKGKYFQNTSESLLLYCVFTSNYSCRKWKKWRKGSANY